MMMSPSNSGGEQRRILLALEAIVRGIDADDVRFSYDAAAAPLLERLSCARAASNDNARAQSAS